MSGSGNGVAGLVFKLQAKSMLASIDRLRRDRVKKRLEGIVG